MVRIKRRIINSQFGETFAVYGVEKKDNIGNWIEVASFTSKREFNFYWNFFYKMKDIEKIGDWENSLEL